MIEQRGDIWSVDAWRVITTNGYVKANGAAVMGRGTALQAAERYPWLPHALGQRLRQGNKVFAWGEIRLFTLPVKHYWSEPADIKLIRGSLVELENLVNLLGLRKVFMPRPGCGNGQLKWEDVRPMMLRLDNRFVVLDRVG